MAKVKYDVTGVESEQSALKPGLYNVRVKEADIRESKKSGQPMLAVVFEVQGGEVDGRILFDYISLDDSMAWKLASFIKGIGLSEKGDLDTDKIVGKKCQVRTVVQKNEEYGEQARIRNILPAKGAAQTDEDLGDDDDDDDEVDYETMSLKELKAEVEARELEGVKSNKKAIIAALEAHDAEDDDDEDESDYSEMSLKELKAAAKEADIPTKGKDKDELIEALEAEDDDDEDESDDDESDDDDDDEDEDEQDYSEMDLDELKSELKERSLKTAGKKAQLIARLEKDDATGEDGEPF